MIRRNQARSTSAMCRTRPSSDNVDDGTAALRSSSSERSSHFIASVARWKSRKARNISRSPATDEISGRSVTTRRD